MVKVVAAFIVVTAFCASPSFAAEDELRNDDASKFSFNHRDAEITNLIVEISKKSGRKFVIDPGVRGKISIITPEKITVRQAYSALTMALAHNGYAIGKQGEFYRVMNARDMQRNLTEVHTELPDTSEEKMITMIIKLKHVSAEDLLKQMRLLASKNGEIYPWAHGNALVMSDFISNVARSIKIIETLDTPAVQKPASK